MLPDMALADLFRRLFSSSPRAGSGEDEALQHDEFADELPEGPPNDFVAGGPTGAGFQGLESAEATDDAIHATDPPRDPAP
jgi:hypothetical protein